MKLESKFTLVALIGVSGGSFFPLQASTYSVARTIVICTGTQEAAQNPFWYRDFETTSPGRLKALLTDDYSESGTPVTDDGRVPRIYQRLLYSGTIITPAKNQVCRIYDLVSARP